MINKGDIVTVQDWVYCDFEGGAWDEHFALVKRHYVVSSEPSNNGNFIARDLRVKTWLNTADVIAVRKRG